MIKVSNRKIIRHIALQELKNSKKMNAVVVMSIILTCLMLYIAYIYRRQLDERYP